MPTFAERILAQVALIHARGVYRRFQRNLADVEATQTQAMLRSLALVADSDFGRRHSLARVRTPDDLRRALPLRRYDDLRNDIDRVWDGHTTALFRPGQRILMFATSSGTTARPKRIPVTPEFVDDYRRGWNTFGLKMLTDHSDAVLRAILQGSGRYDAELSPTGVPCGAITGLLAATQKGVVRRFYVGRPEIARLSEPAARYYTLMRLGIVRDVAFAVTANPATLIRMAQLASDRHEALFRDVHDGTLDADIVTDTRLRQVLSAGLKPQPQRARELESLRATTGALRPRDFWRLSFLACWTGGSMGHYLDTLRAWWGELPVRDIGLLASEGRVTVPLEDNSPAGVLNVGGGLFEFIPAAELESNAPRTFWASELEIGQDYAVVLTNTAGLVRYRLDDVVRMRGRIGAAPVLEFLYRAGRVASVAGEKLTENQVVAAVQSACRKTGVPDLQFLLAPCWADPPYYRLNCAPAVPDSFAATIDAELGEQNEEYKSRRKSLRLGTLQIRQLDLQTFSSLDEQLTVSRQSAAEQYKRPHLAVSPEEADRMLGPSAS